MPPMNFESIVIGTGFGGAIAALRLAEKGQKTLLLERGTWWITPEHLGKPPVSAKETLRAWVQRNNHPLQYWPRPDHREGLLDFFACIRSPANKDGLYKYDTFKEAHVLTASGVGGGSLIYSNVTLKPHDEVLAGLVPRGLKLGKPEFDAAHAWMGKKRGRLNKIVTKIPLPGRDVTLLDDKEDYLYLDRSRALRDSAMAALPKLGIAVSKETWQPLDLSIFEYDGQGGEADNLHTFCERQGRCILGCLPAARHTLNKTLFVHAIRDNANISLLPMSVASDIKQIPGGWSVRYRDNRDGSHHDVTAERLFLAGGTLGTTHLLLVSREKNKLPLSKTLGTRFSTNGDFAGFVVHTKNPVFSTRGPINTSHVGVKIDGTHIAVEDCGLPEMFAAITSTALNVIDSFSRREAFKSRMTASFKNMAFPDLRDFFRLLPDTYDPTSFETEAEMVSNTFFFNAMGQDEANGVMSLDGDDLDIGWPTGLTNQPVFQKIERLLRALAEEMRNQDPLHGPEGRYLPFPLWEGLLDRKVVVTHPLGGCPIGPDSAQGVVNEFGEVYDAAPGKAPTDVLPGLFVVDGSVIPGPLAANPTLTIAAQAVKTVNRAIPIP